MVVGVLRISLMIGDSHSLKDKRRIISSLKDRVRSSFNVSIAEVDAQDLHQRAELAVSAVSADGRYLNGQLDSVLNFIRRDPRAVILKYDIEVF